MKPGTKRKMKIKHFESTASTSQVGRSIESTYFPEATSNANTSDSEDESLEYIDVVDSSIPTPTTEDVKNLTQHPEKTQMSVAVGFISASNLTTSGPMEISVQKGNEMLVKKIRRLKIHIFNDEK